MPYRPAARDRIISPTKRGRCLLLMQGHRTKGHDMRGAYYKAVAVFGRANVRRNASKLAAMPRRMAAVA
jgi:hypothetical protein